MRINPYRYNLHLSQSHPFAVHSTHIPMSQVSDAVEISFKADEVKTNEASSLDLENYKHISGIHCPVCGTKMLSEDEYANIIEMAGDIDNAKDFLMFLNRYKDYIQPNMQHILKIPPTKEVDVTVDKDNPETQVRNDMHVFFENARNEAYEKHKPSINNAKQYLVDFSSSLKDNALKKELLDTLKTVKDIDTFRNFRAKINPVINKIPFDDKKQKHILLHNIYPSVLETSSYLGLYVRDFFYKDMTDKEISRELVKRLFGHSVSKISPISKFENFTDRANNSVFICNKCKVQSARQSFLPSNPELKTELKHNFKVYASDIAYLMGRGEIESNFSYIVNFISLSNKVSLNSVKYDEFTIPRLRALLISASRHDDFEPIKQERVDIPCASCETTLMPHSVKFRFDKDLSKCETLQDYCGIIKKYEKYVGEYSKDLAFEFLNTANDYPNSSDKEFVDRLRQRMIPYYEYETNKILEKMKRGLRYHTESNNKDYIPYFEKSINNFEKYIKDGKFDDFEFYKLHDECFAEIQDDRTPTSLRGIFTDLRLLSYKNSLSKTEDRNAQQDKDAFYTIVYNIFKPSVATVDHLVAMSRGGASDKYNYIGLCKPCNSILKSRSDIYHWYQRVSGVRKHMHKQLGVIDKMAKEGNLEGYEDWASVIAQKMYDETLGRYDVRHLFNQQV